jgi:hypothetical protein
MIIKTTKQIIEELFYLEDIKNIKVRPSDLEPEQVWVSLVELIKEIEHKIKVHKELNAINPMLVSRITISILQDLLNDLCNSTSIIIDEVRTSCKPSEQNEESRVHSEVSDSSVSGEHNTGEDKQNGFATNSKSSPVHTFDIMNADYVRGLDDGYDIGKNSNSSPVQNPICNVCKKEIFRGETIIHTNIGEIHSGCLKIPFKCTCPTERFCFKNKCTMCGGRCGGEL